MSGHHGPITDPYTAIRQALNVLGPGPCPVDNCAGCAVERAEAEALLTIALAAREGSLCERCGGERWVEAAPGDELDTDLCPRCGGFGVEPGYDPLAREPG